jgi:ubiquinone/menaquinone biosynthesis C-methylase UbiE
VSGIDLWEDPVIVDYYADLTALQPPETAILDLLRDRLGSMRMLDIGIGAGRTTLHFSKLAGAYVGVDYSAGMVERCRQRFGDGQQGNVSFHVCDVRSMTSLEDNGFDFVLFSFNGLDCIPHADRLQALREIARVCKPGGYFCFSAHNLRYRARLFGLRHKLTWRPRTMLKRFGHWFRLSFVHNDFVDVMRSGRRGYAMFNDGAHDYRTKLYYISPAEQMAQLGSHFENIRVFLSDGREAASEAEWRGADDWWLYYLCNVKPKAV